MDSDWTPDCCVCGYYGSLEDECGNVFCYTCDSQVCEFVESGILSFSLYLRKWAAFRVWEANRARVLGSWSPPPGVT